MAEKEKKTLPMSTAGLVRYYDIEEKIKLKPEHVIWISVGFAAVVLVLKFMAG